MVFIRVKTRLARGSAVKTCTNEKSVGADRRFRADDEAIRTKTTILNKPTPSGTQRRDFLPACPPYAWLGGGATLRTSSNVVRPWATFIAPLMRKGFMPSL